MSSIDVTIVKERLLISCGWLPRPFLHFAMKLGWMVKKVGFSRRFPVWISKDMPTNCLICSIYLEKSPNSRCRDMGSLLPTFINHFPSHLSRVCRASHPRPNHVRRLPSTTNLASPPDTHIPSFVRTNAANCNATCARVQRRNKCASCEYRCCGEGPGSNY